MRNIVTKQPVHTPADLAGLKIRVPNNRIPINGAENPILVL